MCILISKLIAKCYRFYIPNNENLISVLIVDVLSVLENDIADVQHSTQIPIELEIKLNREQLEK